MSVTRIPTKPRGNVPRRFPDMTKIKLDSESTKLAWQRAWSRVHIKKKNINDIVGKKSPLMVDDDRL